MIAPEPNARKGLSNYRLKGLRGNLFALERTTGFEPATLPRTDAAPLYAIAQRGTSSRATTSTTEKRASAIRRLLNGDLQRLRCMDGVQVGPPVVGGEHPPAPIAGRGVRVFERK